MLVLFFANVLGRAGKRLLQALLSEKRSKIAPGLTRTLFGGYYFWQFIGFSRTAQVQSGSTCHAPPARLDVGRVAPCATFLPSPENGSWHHAGSRDLREIGPSGNFGVGSLNPNAGGNIGTFQKNRLAAPDMYPFHGAGPRIPGRQCACPRQEERTSKATER